ncbi:MAG: glycosyltransferase [Bacteroidetes bacterium]|nr:glycosyltransferase [Bacteroidota bacterium]
MRRAFDKTSILPKLLIVSDTAMWRTKDGIIAFEPVVREIENFEYLFSKITWIGFQQRDRTKQNNARGVVSDKVNIILLPSTGGDTLGAKLKTIILFPYIFIVVFYNVLTHQYIHSRNPSMPGLVSVLFSVFSTRKKFWHKWAGNWISSSHPISYRFQKFFIKIPKKAIVSVNGDWNKQAPNIQNLENPCFNEIELWKNNAIGQQKMFTGRLNICFVGNLVKSKGIMVFLQSLKQIDLSKVNEIQIIGDGILRGEAEKLAAVISDKIIFRGGLNRNQLDEVYGAMHFLCLPSNSEGFPKVIAEAMSFGCIPIVTNISCLSQYIIDGTNGFLLEKNHENIISKNITNLLGMEGARLKEISDHAIQTSKLFTYENYNQKIRKIFNL